MLSKFVALREVEFAKARKDSAEENWKKKQKALQTKENELKQLEAPMQCVFL
jgi:hypothetical protein